MPILSELGSKPIKAVALPMPIRVTTKMKRRPNLSPKWPAKKAPKGRNKKLMPIVANAMIVAAPEPRSEKNNLLKTNPAAAPYMK